MPDIMTPPSKRVSKLIVVQPLEIYVRRGGKLMNFLRFYVIIYRALFNQLFRKYNVVSLVTLAS